MIYWCFLAIDDILLFPRHLLCNWVWRSIRALCELGRLVGVIRCSWIRFGILSFYWVQNSGFMFAMQYSRFDFFPSCHVVLNTSTACIWWWLHSIAWELEYISDSHCSNHFFMSSTQSNERILLLLFFISWFLHSMKVLAICGSGICLTLIIYFYQC